MTTHYVLRPGWVIGITWLAALLLCPWLSDGVRIGVMIVGAAVTLVTALIPVLRRFHPILFVAIGTVLAVGAFEIAYHSRVVPTEARVGETVRLDVTVLESDKAVLLEVQSGELPRGTRIRYYPSDTETELRPYDVFSSSFVLRRYADSSDFSACMRRADGVWLLVEQADEAAIRQTVKAGPVPWTDCFVQLRHALTRPVYEQLDGDVAAVVNGICYGADEQLSAAAVSDFRICGVSHLFAVSGLHMSVLVFGLVALLRRLRMPARWRSVCGIAFLLLFAATVGFSASVARSAVVCATMLIGDMFRLEADARNSMGWALLLLLLIDPFAAYDAGLLLSFSATYGLVCWAKPIQQRLMIVKAPTWLVKLCNALAAAVAVSVAAMLATLPVLAVYFGRISLVSIPANLLTTAVSEVVLVAGCLGSVLSLLGLTVLSNGALLMAGGVSQYLLWICEKISAFSFATVAIHASFLVLWMVGAYAVIGFGWRFLDRWGRGALCGVCVCILCAGVLLHRATTRDTLRVDAVAQYNDLSVALTQNGHTVLVVAPGRANSLYGARDALQQAGVAQIDVLCILGGEEPAVSYIPLVLAEYLTDETQVLYDDLPWEPPLAGQSLSARRITLGTQLTAQLQEGQLVLCWNGQTYRFCARQAEIKSGADAVFCGGEQSVWIAMDGELKPIKPQIRTLIRRDGCWYLS